MDPDRQPSVITIVNAVVIPGERAYASGPPEGTEGGRPTQGRPVGGCGHWRPKKKLLAEGAGCMGRRGGWGEGRLDPLCEGGEKGPRPPPLSAFPDDTAGRSGLPGGGGQHFHGIVKIFRHSVGSKKGRGYTPNPGGVAPSRGHPPPSLLPFP